MPDLMQPCSVPGCPYRECPGQSVCVQHGGQPKPDPPRGPGHSPLDDVKARCTAHRRDGGPCRQPAIKGATTCRLHGSAAPQVREAAAERVVEASIVQEVRTYGVPRPVSAADALQEELDRTNGHIAYLRSVMDRYAAPPPEYLNLYAAERQHLARLADRMAALAVKTADRDVEIRARAVEALELALSGILSELGHDPDNSRVREVIVRHLSRAASGSRRPAAPPPELVAAGGMPLPAEEF